MRFDHPNNSHIQMGICFNYLDREGFTNVIASRNEYNKTTYSFQSLSIAEDNSLCSRELFISLYFCIIVTNSIDPALLILQILALYWKVFGKQKLILPIIIYFQMWELSKNSQPVKNNSYVYSSKWIQILPTVTIWMITRDNYSSSQRIFNS